MTCESSPTVNLGNKESTSETFLFENSDKFIFWFVLPQSLPDHINLNAIKPKCKTLIMNQLRGKLVVLELTRYRRNFASSTKRNKNLQQNKQVEIFTINTLY